MGIEKHASAYPACVDSYFSDSTPPRFQARSHPRPSVTATALTQHGGPGMRNHSLRFQGVSPGIVGP